MTGGLAEVDISPPPGTPKIGWLKHIPADRTRDPLFARVCVLASGSQRIAFVQLDTLAIGRRQVAEIRRRVQEQFNFPGRNVMVAATHNHAGPAVVRIGEVKADEGYVATLTDKIVRAFGEALGRQQDAQVGVGRTFRFGLSHNRRVILRDGRVRTHGRFFSHPDSLCLEGPIDPEVSVLAVRSKSRGERLGCVVNFTLHPAEYGPDPVYSAGWPGVFAAEMKRRGFGVPLFMNGALGNIAVADPTRDGAGADMDTIGNTLAGDAAKVIEELTDWHDDLPLGARSETIDLPYREPTEEQIKGTARGAQRFVDPGVYERTIPELIEEIRTKGKQPAEVQALFVGNWAYAGIPAELFVELGLRIKEQTHPDRHTFVVGMANAMVGYAPHKEAFLRGGYETTFANSSKLAPEAGEMLTDTAVRLVRAGPEPAQSSYSSVFGR